MARTAGRRYTPLLLMAAVGMVLTTLFLVLSRRADAVNSTASRHVYHHHPEKKVAERLVEEIRIVPPQGEIQSERKARLLQEMIIEEDERGDNTITGNGEPPALEKMVTESRASSQTVVSEEEQNNNLQQHQDWGLLEEVVGNNDSVTGKANTEEHSLPLPTAPVPQRPPGGEGPYDIKYIVLIAERHSGSTWMVEFLKIYFRQTEVSVAPTFCAWKHWFQDRIHEGIQSGTRPCRPTKQCPACLDVNHTLVIAMWRNPYDWIGGMFINPHHSKAHTGMKDPSKFMTKRWMLNEKDEIAAREEALIKAKNMDPCVGNFLPMEVVPCRENYRSAIYEVDENGEAYGNIYELRKAKIRDFNAVKNWAPHYERILYEDVVFDENLKEWLQSLDTKYGLGGDFEHSPNPTMSNKMATSRSHMFYLNSETCAPGCVMGGPDGEQARATLHSMWDDQLEGELGYHKIGA